MRLPGPCVQYVPVMGLDGGQSVMALLGGMPFGLPQGGGDCKRCGCVTTSPAAAQAALRSMACGSVRARWFRRPRLATPAHGVPSQLLTHTSSPAPIPRRCPHRCARCAGPGAGQCGAAGGHGHHLPVGRGDRERKEAGAR